MKKTAMIMTILLSALVSSMQADLVGHWALDGDALDSSGYGNHGTVFGGESYVSSLLDQALSFDGIDDYVNCGNDPSLRPTSAVTVAAWVKWDSFGATSGGYAMVSKSTYYHDGFMLYQATGEPFNRVRCFVITIEDGDTWHNICQSETLLDNGRWYHLAMVYDGYEVSLYIDGDYDHSVVGVGAIKWFDPTLNLYLGATYVQGQNTFSGDIDDARIYNHPLTAEEIGDLATLCSPVSVMNLTDEFANPGPLVVPVGPVSFEAVIADGCGQVDAEWDFEDGTADDQSQSDVTDPVTATHTYTSSGIYTTLLTVNDEVANPADIAWIDVVVYDPRGGFVTGGGWIDSPTGAYMPDPSLTGKASFGFVSKYKKGATNPTGQTEFVFKAGSLNFHSGSYDWLVVTGAKAMFKGDGTVNGAGNYGFMLSAVDAAQTPSTDMDLFRIKIWDKDDVDAVVYDNQIGEDDDADPTTGISGGSIMIHKK